MDWDMMKCREKEEDLVEIEREILIVFDSREGGFLNVESK